MLKRIIYIAFIILGFTACKSKKAASGSTNNATMSSRKVIKNHYANKFDKNTINAKLKIKYTGRSSLPGVTASLRMKKDETIWISISKFGIGFAKALITPNKVSYYEKLNRTYFDGDFSLLSEWLGTELDFSKVQNLLIGQAILDLNDQKYAMKTEENKFILTPQKGHVLYDILFTIDPSHYKINKEEIKQKKEDRNLTINYLKYNTVDDLIFPKEMNILASDPHETSSIDIDFRSVQFNTNVSFPFSIPKNYEELKLK